MCTPMFHENIQWKYEYVGADNISGIFSRFKSLSHVRLRRSKAVPLLQFFVVRLISYAAFVVS